MKKILLLCVIFSSINTQSQSVAINTDGSTVTDPAVMLEIKKGGLSKVRIRSLHYSDTSQIELSNRTISAEGTDILLSSNREQGLLISSRSDQVATKQDSMMSLRFNGGRTFLGINLKNPASQLHVHDHSSTLSTLRLTNSATGVTGSRGASLSINSLVATLSNHESGNLNFANNGFVHSGFTSAGFLGLGMTIPSERLELNGNIQMNASNKGIILDNQDRPLITRGFDVFTSGNYTALGRWGLFMEPSRLTLGIPDIAGTGFQFVRYNTNSTLETLLTIDREGEVQTPTTGISNMLPIAYGNISADGSILNGSGNFTSVLVGGTTYDITVTGKTLTSSNSTALLTITSDGQGTLKNWVFFSAGKMRVFIENPNPGTYPRNFSFLIYMP